MKINFWTGFLILGCLLNGCNLHSEKKHECRFWGIIFSEKTPKINNLIKTHLDSLRQLGSNNPDGWGMGYFVPSLNDILLPVIRRAEPSAPIDPRYSEIINEVIRNVEKSAVAHVRKGSSGLTSGIPDPHPFRRKCINRKFDMLFAHNGNINVDVLLSLIFYINPFYLEKNPPDYAPNYLDSDLWAIFLTEIMDTYPGLTIEECIKMAVIKLDSALVLQGAQMNFVMSEGSIIWALNFTKSEPKAITVYYYPDLLISDYWVVASQPLDTLTQKWVEIPNRTLVCLKPDEPVRLIPIFRKFDTIWIKDSNDFFNHPNPFNHTVAINYYVSKNGPVSINIYDESGRLVKRLIQGLEIQGEYTAYWDGVDDKGVYSAGGIYFCHIKDTNKEKVLKLILTR